MRTNIKLNCATGNPATSNQLGITVLGAPTIYNVTGGSPHCFGESVAIGLDGSNISTTYHLLKDGVDTGVSQAGTGGAFIFTPNQTASGVYTVQAVLGNNCNSMMTGSVIIGILPVISVQPVSQTVCEGLPVTFSISTSGLPAPGYQWRKNGVNIGSATNSSYTINSVGSGDAANYDVVVSNNCGSVTSPTATLTVNTAPVITVQPVAPSAVCSGNGTQTLTVTATGTGLTYSWQQNGTPVSNGGVINGQGTERLTLTNPTTADAGNYSVVVSGTCTPPVNSNVVALIVNALPVPIASTNSPVCVGTSLDLLGGPAGMTTYAWTGPNGFSSTLQNPSIIAVTGDAAGTYTLTVTDSNGCPASASTNVIVNAQPVTIASNSSPVCTGASLNLLGSPDGMATYAWTGPNGFTSTTQNPSILATAGTYTLNVNDNNGCSASNTTYVTAYTLPVTTASSNSPVCMGASLNLLGGPAGLTSYSWTGPNGFTSTTQNPSIIAVTADAAGTYTLTVTDSHGCSASATTNVMVNTLPIATIAYAGSPYCATGTTAVTQSGQTGGTYTSTAGLVIDPTTGALNLATSAPGTYTVTYSFTNGTCPNTTTASVTINALPIANIAYAGSPYCATGTASVTQTGQAGGTYSSTAGLSINAATGVINLVTSTAGTYTVTYNFTNGTCPNTTTTSVTIDALPIANIAYAGSPYCATGTASVTQTGQTGGTYSSIAGLSINAVTGAINLANSTAGTYTVTYSFTNGTCPNTTTTSVTINALPIANIAYAGSPYCATGTASVTQTGQAGGTYSSTAGLVIDASTGAINLATSTPGTYTVTYGFTNGTCLNTTTASVTINALPVATIVYSGSPYCATGTANVTQTGQAGGTYNSGAGLTINPGTGAINLATSIPGTYTVIYSFSNGSCPNITTATLIVNIKPVISVQPLSQSVCLGSSVTLSVTASGIPAPGYQWLKGLGPIPGATLSTYTIPSVSLSDAGSYKVATNNSYGITTSTSAILTVSPISGGGTAASNQTICSGNSPANITLSAYTGTIQWQSSSDNLTFNDIPGAITTPLTSIQMGTLTVTTYYRAVVTSGLCPAAYSNTVTVTVNALPAIPTANNNGPLCAGATLNLTTPTVAGATYSWTGPNSFISALQNPSKAGVTMADAGAYNVTVTVNGCTSPAGSTTVVVNPIPTPTISGVASVCISSTTSTYDTESGMSSYTWNISAGGTITSGKLTNEITVTWNSTGTQTVSVTYTDLNGCTAVNPTIYNVTVNPLPTPALSGNTTVCLNSTGNVYNTESGMTDYVWTVYGGTITSGGHTTDNTVTITWNSLDFHSLSVNYANGAGCIADSPTSQNVTVNQSPTIDTQPVSSTICSGLNTSFSVAAFGTGLTYQWQVNTGTGFTNVMNTGVYSGATTATLNITAATEIMTGYIYQCIVNGTCAPSAISNSATLTVNTPPAISQIPLPQQICLGNNATFTISATGTGLTYQWQEWAGSAFNNITNGGVYGEATTSILTLSATPAGRSG